MTNSNNVFIPAPPNSLIGSPEASVLRIVLDCTPEELLEKKEEILRYMEEKLGIPIQLRKHKDEKTLLGCEIQKFCN